MYKTPERTYKVFKNDTVSEDSKNLALLRILSDQRCLDILRIISIEPSYVGELAIILKTKGPRISEKVRMMRKAGIVSEEWKKSGKKFVKYVRPSIRGIRITFDKGLMIETKAYGKTGKTIPGPGARPRTRG